MSWENCRWWQGDVGLGRIVISVCVCAPLLPGGTHPRPHHAHQDHGRHGVLGQVVRGAWQSWAAGIDHRVRSWSAPWSAWSAHLINAVVRWQRQLQVCGLEQEAARWGVGCVGAPCPAVHLEAASARKLVESTASSCHCTQQLLHLCLHAVDHPCVSTGVQGGAAAMGLPPCRAWQP